MLESDIKQFIKQLAERHSVRYVRTRGDELADAIARLSGDDVSLDDTEQLLLALEREKVLTQDEAFELFNQYSDRQSR